MVPNGWKLGQVQDLILGLESGISVNAEDRPKVAGEKAVLKISSISYGYFNDKAHKVITDSHELSRARTTPKIGQVIISRANTYELVGASAYIEQNHNDLFLPDKLWQTISKPGIDMKWLSYVLASDPSRYILSRLSTGTSYSMRNITKGELLTLKVLIPPLPEQQRIAKILSTWDKAISTTEKLIATSKEQKKALMQQLLTGNKRLKNPKTDNPFGVEWEDVELGDLFDFHRGKGVSKKDVQENAINPCILYGELYTKYPEVIRGIISYTNLETGFKSKAGDILIPSSTTTTGIDLANATALLEGGIQLGGDINILRAKRNLNSPFIAYLITHIKKYDIASRAQGITIIHIYNSDLKPIKIKLPIKVSEQQKIASVITTSDKEIEVLSAKLVHFKQEKKALMQQLLTGKKRVKVDKLEVA